MPFVANYLPVTRLTGFGDSCGFTGVALESIAVRDHSQRGRFRFFVFFSAWKKRGNFLGWSDVWCMSFFNSGGGFGVDLFLIHLDEMIINDNDIGSYFVHIYIYIYIHSTIHCMYFSHFFSLLDDGDIGTSSIPPSFGLAPWTRRNALERWWSLFASKELLWRSPQPSTAFLVPKFSWSSQTWMIWMFVLLFVPGDWCENSSTMKIPCRPRPLQMIRIFRDFSRRTSCQKPPTKVWPPGGRYHGTDDAPPNATTQRGGRFSHPPKHVGRGVEVKIGSLSLPNFQKEVHWLKRDYFPGKYLEHSIFAVETLIFG